MDFHERFADKHLPRRIFVMLISVTVMGLGISLFLIGGMGSDPFSTLNLGISSKLGLSFGTWQAGLNIALLVLILLIDRSMLGLGTVANMLLVGFSADFFSPILAKIVDADALPVWARLLFTLGGAAMQIIGCSFYVTANLGMAPYDCISYLVPNRTKIPFRLWRILLDVVCVAVGFVCGSAVGIGTLIMAFGTGPLLPLCNKYLAEPILKPAKVNM